MMKAATGPDDFTMEHIYEFKQLVSQELTKYVSSILLDEEYGFRDRSKESQRWIDPFL